jgi:nitrogen regulatory protein PII
MIMKMLTIVCREQLEDEVLAILSALGITGYTVIHGVGGSGETGAVSLTQVWAKGNKLLFVALEDDRMAILVQAVRQLQTKMVQEHAGHPVPFKAFLQPCELIV